MKKVLVSGVFNILHAEHCNLLEFAASFGPVTVGINGDEYNLKKNGALAVPLKYRVKCLESCRYVEEVQVFHEETPERLLRELKPDIYVKGPDYLNVEIPEQKLCDELGIKIIYLPTTKTLNSSEYSVNVQSFLDRVVK